MQYVRINGTLFSVQEKPMHSMDELFEKFLITKGIPTPFTPKADIENWIKRRQKFMDDLGNVYDAFTAWLIQIYAFREVRVSEVIEV